MSDIMSRTPDTDDDLVSEGQFLPWDDPAHLYRAFHTRQGRITQICFIPNSGTHDRYLQLADLRVMDPSKDGKEIVLEFSAMTVVVSGRFLRRGAGAIGAGRCEALEAFDVTRRRLSDDPAAPVIESIRFFVPKQQSDTGNETPRGRSGPPKPPRAV
jgi:hypothetical protein